MNPADARKLLRAVPNAPVRVKICGLTNAADAEAAIAAGADALGFNFYPGSKRFLDLPRERAWLAAISPDVLRVAVVVNPEPETALSWLAEPFIDALQLHGGETPAFCRWLEENQPKPIIKAIRIRDAASLAELRAHGTRPLLLDAFSEAAFGGTGETFDWKLLEQLPDRSSLILSGGLRPENVATAVRFTKLRFLDVASGVEDAPRQKSARRMREFVANARIFPH